MNPKVDTNQPASSLHMRLRDRLLAVTLASISGAALVLHVYAGLPMSFTISFVALPIGTLFGAALIWQRRLQGQLRSFMDLAIAGAKWGFIGTLAYDTIRPILKWLIQYRFDAFGAMPIFGQLITGLPASDPRAVAAGWIYHFWNGTTFGVMFAFVKPKGGVIPGFLWGMMLQGLMLVLYPALFKIRMNDPGFLIAGFVGHSVWGMVLGSGLRSRS